MILKYHENKAKYELYKEIKKERKGNEENGLIGKERQKEREREASEGHRKRVRAERDGEKIKKGVR